MKIFLVSALLGIGSSPLAQDKTPSGTPGEIKNSLIKIEREIGRANLDCDYRYFDRVEAEEFIFTNSAGSVTNKKEDLAGEKDCHKSDGTYEVDETDVRLYGATAVVTGRVTTARKNKEDKLVVRHTRFTDVFVWRDQRWQLVAGHSSRIPDPAPQK